MYSDLFISIFFVIMRSDVIKATTTSLHVVINLRNVFKRDQTDTHILSYHPNACVHTLNIQTHTHTHTFSNKLYKCSCARTCNTHSLGQVHLCCSVIPGGGSEQVFLQTWEKNSNNNPAAEKCTFTQFSLSFLPLGINQRDAPFVCVRTLRSLNPFLISLSLSLSLSRSALSQSPCDTF